MGLRCEYLDFPNYSDLTLIGLLVKVLSRSAINSMIFWQGYICIEIIDHKWEDAMYVRMIGHILSKNVSIFS